MHLMILKGISPFKMHRNTGISVFGLREDIFVHLCIRSYDFKLQTNETIFLLRTVDNIICSSHEF